MVARETHSICKIITLMGINFISKIIIKVNLQKLENGDFLATSDNVPGLVAQGRTVTETFEIAQDVTRKIIESYQEHDDELPHIMQKTAS